jgi:hypothetical protein
VLGYIVRCPLGGLAWHHLQYVLGLARLGHQVYFLEDSGDSRWCCYDPSTGFNGTDASYGLRFVADLFERTGLADRWGYFDAQRASWTGPCASHIREIIAGADVLLNVSGVNRLIAGLETVPVRVFIDTDPVFNQVRNLTDPAASESARRHNRFFSFAENIVHDGTSIPNDGLPWQPTRQPIVLDVWTAAPPCDRGLFTTVMQWDSYDGSEYQGTHYGMKSESFLPFLSLPGKVGPLFELSLGTPSAPRHLLLQSGWKLRNPLDSAGDPWSYQAYVRQSKGEFTVAKQGYAATRCGWFSERSAAYLASGRPVIAQETGFSDWMESGRGVIPFQTLDEAIAAVNEIQSNYRSHCRTARSLAETYFDSDQVLAELVAQAMNKSVLQPAWTG